MTYGCSTGHYLDCDWSVLGASKHACGIAQLLLAKVLPHQQVSLESLLHVAHKKLSSWQRVDGC